MEKLSSTSFYVSILAVLLAAIGALGLDVWLASTQWIIVAAVLAIWAIYLRDQGPGKVE
jgi:hypothetical protein